MAGSAAAQQRISHSTPAVPESIRLYKAYPGSQADFGWSVETSATTAALKVSDLMVLGEALRILARLQADGPVGHTVGDAAALGCATIQMVLEGFM